MFKRAYIEITNVCNLSCSFCKGTCRAAKFMSVDEFTVIANKVRPLTEYIYLHVMGEPLLHPQLSAILSVAEGLGFRVQITTNGTLLPARGQTLLSSAAVRKVSVSLHSQEGNGLSDGLTPYLSGVWDFCQKAPFLVELRLWNGGAEHGENQKIFDFLSQKLGKDVLSLPMTAGGRKLADRLYLTEAEEFAWPSLSAPLCGTKSCYGMKTQFGVLVDGSVVPCCLDSDGVVTFGNLLTDEAETVFSSDRARAFVEGFRRSQPREELCRRCGFATRFS